MTSSHELSSGRFAVKRPSSPWLRPIGTKYVVLSCHERRQLGRFAPLAVPGGWDEIRSVEVSSILFFSHPRSEEIGHTTNVLTPFISADLCHSD